MRAIIDTKLNVDKSLTLTGIQRFPANTLVTSFNDNVIYMLTFGDEVGTSFNFLQLKDLMPSETETCSHTLEF